MAEEKSKGRVLLPDTVIPSRYDLRLTPDLEQFAFDGRVRITVDVHEATNEVCMHAQELQILSATFKAGSDHDGAPIELIEMTQNFKKHILKLIFSEMLPVGEGILEIEFKGILNNQMAGFYRSQYTDIHGAKKVMASTQFESVSARRCLPCWDEPARKAVFAVTLVINPGLVAFSNMPEKSSQLVKVNSKYLRELAYMDTPKMSTYLLAFVVGEFDFIQAQTQHGVLIRVYTPPGQTFRGTFALDVAMRCLDLYDDFFGIHFPLPKMDMVGIPEFAMGAMENWGLVTYREVDILIDPATASNTQKQRVAGIVAHELAHQWFGNLVTMAWWDDLWLNEGFAQWCQYWAPDKLMPDYLMWDQFLTDCLAIALRLDGLETSHPIQVPIHEAEEVDQVFDGISYMKGASVVRMAHSILGHEAFQKGLKAYMEKFKYSNTETFDLWEAWADASGMPVKGIMSSWTEQMGYPMLQVKEMKITDGKARLSLEQSWFLTSGEPPKKKCKWCIPVFVSTAQTTQPMVTMTEESMNLEIPIGSDSDFILLNQGMQTPMRVLYTPEMMQRLIGALSAGQLATADRTMLLVDATALTQAGKLRADELLRLLAAYSNEKEYAVWQAMAALMVSMLNTLRAGAPEQVYEQYIDFCEMLVSKGWEATDVGFTRKPSDGHLTGLLRGLMMKMMSKYAPKPEFLSEANARFQKYVEDPSANAQELPEDYRQAIFQAVLSKGGAIENARLMEAFSKLQTTVEKKHVYLSIGFSNDVKLKEAALHWATSGEIKIQDFFYIFASVSDSSREGLDLTWSFFKQEFSRISSMVATANPNLMDHCITFSCGAFCSEAKADEVEKFFTENPLPRNTRCISQQVEKIRNNAKFLAHVLATDVMKPEFWTDVKQRL